MSSPHADADDIIVTAGTNTLQLADNEMTQEIVDHIKMVGKKMVALVRLVSRSAFSSRCS